MHKIWVVVRREFLERVRSRWFVIATVLGPLIMALAMFLPAYLLTKSSGARNVIVVDVTSDQFGRRVATALNGSGTFKAVALATAPNRVGPVADSLAGRVGAKALDGFLIVTDSTSTDGEAEYRGSNVSSQMAMGNLRRLLQDAVLTERLERVGIDPDLVAKARLSVDLKTVNIRGGKVTEQSGQAAFALAYVMWFVLYFALIVYGIQVAGAVVEEKSSRVIEVLVSSLKPFQLLAGKVIGVGSVGLFQLLIWAAVAAVLIGQQSFFLHALGIDVPEGRVFGLSGVPLDTIGVLLLYFVLGFFLYATMFAAVGAMSSSEAEARQAQQPIVFVIVIPALMAFAALNDPNGSVAVALTLIPFSAPIAMPVRWSVAAVPIQDLVLSVSLLILAAIGVTWVAGRIYRVGILMYGKRPNLTELLRWIRRT